MDQALKARLIGAAILVALAVLVIPELLSGRKAASTAPVENASPASTSTRTYTIELDTASTQSGGGSAPAVPAQPPKDARLPAPATAATTANEESAGSAGEAAAAPEPAAGSAAAVAKPGPATAKSASSTTSQTGSASVAATTPAPATPASNAAAPTRGTWSVQVGAFGSADAARKLKGDLQKAGYSAYISPITKSGKTLHRVRVGPETARASADSLASRLKSRGLPATVVAND